MENYTVFIVDSNIELLEKLKKRVNNTNGFKLIGSASNIEDSIRKLKVIGGVDLLITELFIDIDKDLLYLHKLNKEKLNIKKIICTTSIIDEEILKNISSKGVDYLFLKPFDIKSVFYISKIVLKGSSNTIIERYIDSYNECNDNEDINKNHEKIRIEEKVTILLHNIGIPAHIKGYVYIRCAIMESFYNPNHIGQITKKLYPEIARRYSSTPSRVERAIRHAIEIAWNRGSVDLIDRIFGYTINANKAKPTNSEFIAMLTDKLRLELKANITHIS